MTKWEEAKNILCIRLDNMGDVIMSGPAMRALKESLECKITLLTSSASAGIAQLVGADDVIISDVPWVKLNRSEGAEGYLALIARLKTHKFDAAVVFTVFSQNPMPSIMLAYLAGIPLRLAYCRENPYELLTHWIPDQEPYSIIKHQVKRDLDLVASVGAYTQDERLQLTHSSAALAMLKAKIDSYDIRVDQPWLVVHPCASEVKREYPFDGFISILNKLRESNIQLIFTGVRSENDKIKAIQRGLSSPSVSLAGELSLEEFIALIQIAPALLSVNTGPVHIAAALQTPVVVLYALTNPQHSPWMCPHKMFTFPVAEELKSKNEVLRYIDRHVMESTGKYPEDSEVVTAVQDFLKISFPLPVQPAQNPEFPAN